MPKFTDIADRPVEVVPVVQNYFCRSTSSERVKLYFQVRVVAEPDRYAVLGYDNPLEGLKAVAFEGIVVSDYAKSAEEVRFIGWNRPHSEAYHPDLSELRNIVGVMEKIEKALQKAIKAAEESGFAWNFGAAAAVVAKLYGAKTFIERRQVSGSGHLDQKERGIGEIARIVNEMVAEAEHKTRVVKGFVKEEMGS